MINYYDGTLSHTQIGFIPAALDAANKAFKKQFGVTLYADSSPYLTNEFTTCRIADENGGQCNCLNHHKDTVWISDKLYEEVNSDRERIILWTDCPKGTYCEHNNENKCFYPEQADGLPGGKIAVVYEYRPVIHFLNLQADDGRSDQYLARMAEEGIQCVMEQYPQDQKQIDDFYKSLKDEGCDAFCSNCETKLKALMRQEHIIP